MRKREGIIFISAQEVGFFDQQEERCADSEMEFCSHDFILLPPYFVLLYHPFGNISEDSHNRFGHLCGFTNLPGDSLMEYSGCPGDESPPPLRLSC